MEVLFKNKKTPVNIQIKENELLNDFVVVDSNMNEVNTKDIKGNKLILTVPSVDTRVCSIELSKFVCAKWGFYPIWSQRCSICALFASRKV